MLSGFIINSLLINSIYVCQMDRAIRSATWMLIFYLIKHPKHIAMCYLQMLLMLVLLKHCESSGLAWGELNIAILGNRIKICLKKMILFSCPQMWLLLVSSKVFISCCVATFHRHVINILIMYTSATDNVRLQDECNSTTLLHRLRLYCMLL